MQNVKYLAGVSGGPDSMALLDMYQKQIKAVCHVNYRHRPTANRDTNIVKRYCKAHKMSCYVLNVTPTIYKKYHKHSNNFQTIARLIRYDFFKSISRKIKLSTILIAHNQDDFLETALMQERKHSISPFYGINEFLKYGELNVWRPLLWNRKQSLKDYCDEHKIKYGSDETNDDIKYERNKIRKEISKWNKLTYNNKLLQIQRYNTRHETLCRKTNSEYTNWSKHDYPIQIFNKLNVKHQPYVMYKYLIANNISNPSSNKINQIVNFIKHGSGKLRVANMLGITKVNKYVKIVTL